MSTDRFWIALVDVRPDTPDNPEWLDSFGDSSAGGFVHVMGMARNAPAFQQDVADDLATQGWVAAGFDDVELLSALRTREPLSPAFEEMEQALLETGELQFGRFFLYPSEESSPQDWLAQEAEDRRLTNTQRTVLSNLSRMLRHLTLPQLDEGIGLTGQGTDVLEVHLPHRNLEELDLTILVRLDGEITVDYEYGHVHFTPALGDDWLNQALEFVYGALQGGVRVEIWATGTRLDQSRPLILLDSGEWFAFPLWSSTPESRRGNSPTLVKTLSFLEPEAS